MGKEAGKRHDGSRMARASGLLLRLFRPARSSKKPGAPEFVQAWARLSSEIPVTEGQPRRSEARGYTAGGPGEPGPHQVHSGRSGIPKGLRQPQPTAAPPAEGGVW